MMMMRKIESRNAPVSGYTNNNSRIKGADAHQLVAVAVDDDKNSQHALKWAADNLFGSGNFFALIHVRKRDANISSSSSQHLPTADVEEDVASAFSAQMDFQTQGLLVPFQVFCRRRKLKFRVVILDNMNIAEAINDFILQHGADYLALGASSRNAFSRTFMQADVPFTVSKTAPEFCSVYVISKGKLSSSRPSTRPKYHHFSGLYNDFEIDENQLPVSKSETIARSHVDNPRRIASTNSMQSRYGGQPGPPRVQDQRNIGRGFNHSGEAHELSFHSVASCASPSRTSIDKKTGYSPRIFDSGRQLPRLSASSNHETSYLEEVPYSFESCRTSIDKKTGYSPRIFDSGRQHPRLSASSTRENSYLEEGMDSFESCRTASSSSEYGQFPPTDESEYELRRLKLELKMAVGKYQVASDKVYYKKSDDELNGGDPWLDRERTLEMNKKDEMRLRVQATERNMNEPTGGDPWLDRERILEPNKKDGTRPGVQASERKMDIDFDTTIGRENAFPQKIGVGFSSEAQYRKYNITEIKEVTNNFSESLKIGEGGYGPVYKSTLDQTLVAIKVPRPDVVRGMEQFQQEVDVLSRIRHPNLVLLLGACPEHGCLVYEYMDNGNLEDRLFCRSGTAPLSWQLRFKIAAEIASALLYLHQTKPEPLIHRDLKPANILLDENFASKITDVGLARLLPPSTSTCSSQYLATVAAGTFCYIDPEYQKTGNVGVKSDVYALGIIMLQLITARPPMGLAYTAEDALEMGTFDKMLDPKVPDWPMEETVKIGKLGVMCAELRRRDRPDLASVVLPELNRLRELADASL